MGDETETDPAPTPTIPWWQSRIIQQQVAVLLGSLTALLGVAAGFNWDAWVQALFGGVGAVVALWTIVTRLRRATPPITQVGAARTAQKQAELTGKAPPAGGTTAPDSGGKT